MSYPKRFGARLAGENDCSGELDCTGGVDVVGLNIGLVIGGCICSPVEPGLNIGDVIPGFSCKGVDEVGLYIGIGVPGANGFPDSIGDVIGV
jgi:hypothetical protein